MRRPSDRISIGGNVDARRPAVAGPGSRLDAPMVDPERSSALREAAAEAAGCVRCPLAEGRTQVVFGEGNPDADLVLVGEAPGFHEDREGGRSPVARGSSSSGFSGPSSSRSTTRTSRRC